MKEMAAELEASDGSKQSMKASRDRMARENARLSELQKEEAEARRSAEAAQMEDIKALWTKFQTIITQEQEDYSKLEESRRALVSSLFLSTAGLAS